MSKELKPCPFCGGKPEHRTAGKHSIFCKKCGVEMEHYITGTGFYKRFESYGHVKTAWNRRVEPKRGEWKTWEEQFPDKKTPKKNRLGVFCSVCQLHADNMFNFCPNCGADMRENEKE
jgi:Lar family restriction alleviation protein